MIIKKVKNNYIQYNKVKVKKIEIKLNFMRKIE